MRAELIVNPITNSLCALLLGDFYISFLLSLLSVIVLAASSRVPLYSNPLNPKIASLRNKTTAPSPDASWVCHCSESREAEQGCAGLSLLWASLHRDTPTLMEPLGLFWGFPTCRSYSTKLQPFIYKLSMKSDCGGFTWAGPRCPALPWSSGHGRGQN